MDQVGFRQSKGVRAVSVMASGAVLVLVLVLEGRWWCVVVSSAVVG